MAQMAGPDPLWTICPNCNTEILTTTQKSKYTLTAQHFGPFLSITTILSDLMQYADGNSFT